jgi:hypothetical protein
MPPRDKAGFSCTAAEPSVKVEAGVYRTMWPRFFSITSSEHVLKLVEARNEWKGPGARIATVCLDLGFLSASAQLNLPNMSS